MADDVYNPLDKLHLAESIIRALIARTPGSLPAPRSAFLGAGVYAIYYLGPFPLYAPLSSPDCVTPVYVGKAMPPGGRTGGLGLTTQTTRTLYDRLREHQKSLDEATNLEASHFRCRFLLVDDIWIPLAENYLISTYHPLWNSNVLSGFGIHQPGGRRIRQRRSLWDTLHPGRRLARGLPENEVPLSTLEDSVRRALAGEIPLDPSASEGSSDLSRDDGS